MGPVELVYLAAATACARLLFRRAENKPLMAVALLWLFDNPILGRPGVMPSVPGLGVAMTPTRLVFTLLGGAALFRLGRMVFVRTMRDAPASARISPEHLRFYEKALIAYTFLACVTDFTNLNQLDLTTVRQLIFGQLTFPLVYWAAKRYATTRDVHVLCTALAVLAIASSFVGIIQFFMVRTFLNGATSGDVSRYTFGSLFRSPGLFFAEYDQGIFLVLSLIAVRFLSPSRRLTALVLIASAGGVAVTFHRLSWLVMVGVLVLFGICWGRRHAGAAVSSAAGIVLLATALVLGLPSVVSSSSLDALTARLTQDTLHARGDLNVFGLYMIQKYPSGIGDSSSRVYVREGLHAKVPIVSSTDRVPLVVHDGFLMAGVSHGIAGLGAVLGFLGGALMYFARRLHGGFATSAFPFFLVLSFIAFNFTNDFSWFGAPSPLFFAFLLGFAARHELNSRSVASLSPEVWHGAC